MPEALLVNPDELVTFAAANESLGTEVLNSTKPDPALAASAGAYGAVGATFTVALTQYVTRLQASGAQLAGRYQKQAAAVRGVAAAVVTTDRNNALRTDAAAPH